ncbi:selenoprotein K-like [Photinus pyralis]|uniref:selenoprotein K-like n=1 Tax=Photinus pyralis TaxID=7054 RepID=UPI001267162C|nr:selenoprotein K-like [Photinus pyralis]
MVYVTGGQLKESPPWSLERLVSLFWGIIAFFIMFFKTLVGVDDKSRNGRSGGPGGGPGGGPKRIGRVTTIDDCSMPGGG